MGFLAHGYSPDSRSATYRAVGISAASPSWRNTQMMSRRAWKRMAGICQECSIRYGRPTHGGGLFASAGGQTANTATMQQTAARRLGMGHPAIPR